MSQGIESHIDWTAPSKPHGERAGRGSTSRPDRHLPPASEKRKVMDTLLGKNNLSAADVSGDDPYNATGRHFRR
jgi:hypothetical protein